MDTPTSKKRGQIFDNQNSKTTSSRKSYISKLENAKGNIQLSTLIRIFETGLGRRVGLTFM